MKEVTNAKLNKIIAISVRVLPLKKKAISPPKIPPPRQNIRTKKTIDSLKIMHFDSRVNGRLVKKITYGERKI